MDIAIIGAGLAGLSCAHELERYGISPVIFEDLDFIGEREEHVAANLNVTDRPVKDLPEYYREKCHLELTPVNTINKLTHYSSSKKTVIRGKNLGYFFKRGNACDTLKGQIYSQLSNTKTILGTKADYRELAREYDYVVDASGLPGTAKELGCWNELISGWIRGARVESEFDPNELVMWLNHKYCKNGYAYLCPYDTKAATLALFVPYVNNITMDYYWERFLTIEKLGYKITDEFSIEHFSGFVQPHRCGNIFFAGNSGGAVSPLLGFGQTNSISMGVLAAQSIVEGIDYEKLLKTITDKEKASFEIRKTFDTLTDENYDTMLSIMGLPGVRHFIYNTNINIIKLFGDTLKLASKLARKR